MHSPKVATTTTLVIENMEDTTICSNSTCFLVEIKATEGMNSNTIMLSISHGLFLSSHFFASLYFTLNQLSLTAVFVSSLFEEVSWYQRVPLHPL